MNTPRFLGLYTAIYHVADLDRAKAWYARMLGQQPYFDQAFYVGFNVAGHELGLLPAPAPAGCVAYWGVQDARAALDALVAEGATLFEEVTDVGDGIKVATVRDADGNIVGLIENPHFPNNAT